MRAAVAPRQAPLVAAAAVVVLLAGIALAAPVLAPLLFTFLATILCRPGHLALIRRGTPGWLAMLVVAAAYVLVLGSLGLVLALSLANLARDLPSYLASAPPLPDQAAALVERAAEAVTVDQATVVAALTRVVASVVDAAVFFVFSALILAYLLLDADRLRRRLGAALPAGSRVLPAYDRLAGDLVEYIKVRAVLGAAAAAADTVLLMVLGVPSPFLWGVVSFLFSFVPNIGFIVALIPPTIFGFLVGGFGTALLVVLGYTAINLLFDYILQPKVMGKALDLSAAVVILSIGLWTWIIGPIGAILAVPLTIVVRAILRENPATRPLAALVGDPGAPTTVAGEVQAADAASVADGATAAPTTVAGRA